MLVLVSVISTVVGFVAGVVYVNWKHQPMHLHGLHEHACACGNTWQHDDNLLTIGGIHDAHVCTSCGAVVLEVARLIEPP